MTADDRNQGAAPDSRTTVMSAEPRPDDPWDALRSHIGDGPELQGYRNRNYRVDVPESLARELCLQEGTPVKIRVPMSSGYPFDQAVWPNEGDILEALKRHLTVVPRVLATKTDYSVQTFVHGDVLSRERLQAGPNEDPILREVARFFASLAGISVDGLPRSPDDWPESGESSDFLRILVKYTEEKVRKPVWPRYGMLLEELGFPEDAMTRFRDALPELMPRPFVLLHADVHPGNLIMTEDGSLHVIDWELAMVGDPLHDLAIHLTRSQYTRRDRRRFISLWVEEVGRVNEGAVQGVRQDLGWYRAYQRLRSVYTDVVRTVEGLAGDGTTPDAVEQAARKLRRIVGRAPLAIGDRPSYGQARGALQRWLAGNAPTSALRAADRGLSRVD